MENLQVHAFSSEKAIEYVNKYTDFGVHRTGSKTEIQSTKWIAQQLENTGFDTHLQELTFKRFELKKCKIIVGNKEIKAFPFWFPLATGDIPVTASITFYDEENTESMHGKIVYYDMPGLQTNSDISKVASTAKSAGALAVVSTVVQPNGFPAGQNTSNDNTQNELPLPSVIVSMTEKDFIIESINKNSIASVLIDGDVEHNAKCYNVISKIDNKCDEWIVVTTPISGWFSCNAERGAGVGLFLELANTVKTWKSNVNYLFVGTTGHELHFLGANATDEIIPTCDKVKVWLHCGSAIACKQPIMPNFKFLGFSDDIAEEVKTAFKDIEDLTVQNDKEKLMQSELGNCISKGYTVFGLYGANIDFHTEMDIDDGVSEDELCQIGEAIISIFKKFA